MLPGNNEWHQGLALVGVVFSLTAVAIVFAHGCAIPESKLEKGAADFCKARTNYKVLAAAVGGALDPVPGSPRAALEAQEDVFCANVAAIAQDAGPRAN